MAKVLLSAIAAILAGALLVVVIAGAIGAPAAGAKSREASSAGTAHVVIAVLPRGTTVDQIARAEGISPGVVSGGLGKVDAAQTYLDISQGNRVHEPLYESDLPALWLGAKRVRSSGWSEVLERAESAPAEIFPGLLASTLAEAGLTAVAEAGPGKASLIAVERAGELRTVPDGGCGSRGCGPGLSVLAVDVRAIRGLIRVLRRDDLLIALARAPATQGNLLPVGIAGSGYDGTLTSDSTRTRGIVVSTDIAVTVLERLRLDVPDEMNGTEIEAEGEPDPGAVEDVRERAVERPPREAVILAPLGAWVLLAGLAALAFGSRGSRVALPLLALSCVWAPATFLIGAALEPGTVAEALINGLGSPALAVATFALLPGYRALALACTVTVAAYAVDVVLGSPLTAFSVLGPNPGGGVRFFGIGNELEATVTTLTLIGAGAWLGAFRSPSRRAAAAGFLGAATLAAVAFAPGRFGADVGAAIVLAAGGAAAAAVALGLDRRQTLTLVLALPALGIALLALGDLVFGGAHLSSSVLGAEDAGDLRDVADRRVTLMARSFTDPAYPFLLPLALVLLVAGFIARHRVLSWFGASWPARAGYLGTVVAVLVATVANDSGAVLLVIGTIYLGACAGFFWAIPGESRGIRRPRIVG